MTVEAVPPETFVANLSTAWQNGWIVFRDPTITGVPAVGSVLRLQKPFSGTDTFVSSGITSVSFNREGYAPVATNTLITLHDSTNTNAWTRCLTLNFVGQITTLMVGTAPNGAICL